MKVFAIVTLFVASACADVSHILSGDQLPPHHGDEYATTTTTPQPPPHPYVFSYSAGRAPGHIDRTHSEVSDGSGTVRGAFSYVDPLQQVRTVEYEADENGFRPKLSWDDSAGPKDTEAVELAKQRHTQLYNRIAEANQTPRPIGSGPRESAAVVRATEKHHNLFEQIAAEHARIGAEQEALRIAFEATSVANDIYEHVQE